MQISSREFDAEQAVEVHAQKRESTDSVRRP